MFIYFLLFLNHLSIVSLSITIPSKGILPLDKNSVALQFYFDIKNEYQVPCQVFTRFKKCLSDKERDNNFMFLYGSHNQNIMPRGRETFVFVYPSIFHHDKTGVCYFLVNYKCGRKTQRQLLDIPFDTRLTSMGRKSQQLKGYIGQKVMRNCDSIDEDSLDDCSQVNCELKYMDEKTFYDVNENRCVRAVECIGHVKNDLPTTAYLPEVNICRDLEHPVEIHDIYALNNGMSVVTDTPKYAPELKAVIESNCSTISEKLSFLKDVFTGKMYPSVQGVNVDYSAICKRTILSILGYIVCICSSIVALVCCMHTLVCLYKKWYNGDLKKGWTHVKQKFKASEDTPEPTRKCSTFMIKSQSNSRVKYELIRDVIYRDIPLELRSSVIDVCDRIGKEVRREKRYRVGQVQVPFECDGDRTYTSTDSLRGNTSVTSEEETLLK